MEIIETPWDLFSSLLVFLIGLFIILKKSRAFNTNWRRSAFLYFWHTIFCVIYLYYTSKFGGDAIVYYDVLRKSHSIINSCEKMKYSKRPMSKQ